MVNDSSFFRLCFGQSRTESSRDTDDDTLALDLLGQVDLVAGRVLHQDIQVGDGVALLDEGRRGVMEERGLGPDAGELSSETASGEHSEMYIGSEVTLGWEKLKRVWREKEWETGGC